MTLPLAAIAAVCHDANRAYCQVLGDDSPAPWPQASRWQQESAIKGVAFVRDHPDAGPEASHESWLEEKLAAEWVYGPEKNPDRKEHPCMVRHDRLPEEQQVKDRLFIANAKALLGL